MSFVLSVIRPPEGEAKYGKATTLDPVGTMAAVERRVEYVLKSEGADTNDAVSFSLVVGAADPGWQILPHDGTGLTFRVDKAEDTPHPCPCCGRLVLPTDHAYADAEDAYCTGCFTWSRNTEACLPENSAHATEGEEP